MALSRIFCCAVVALAFTSVSPLNAQDAPAKPQLSGDKWLDSLDAYEGRAVEVSVAARHIGSQRMFMFGEKEGHEIRVLIPSPSVDTASIGDKVTVVGTVRHFDAKVFARDYRWFRAEDYPDVPNAALVIVAASVRSPEGADLVPGDRANQPQGAAR